jgi:hypothetical protein
MAPRAVGVTVNATNNAPITKSAMGCAPIRRFGCAGRAARPGGINRKINQQVGYLRESEKGNGRLVGAGWFLGHRCAVTDARRGVQCRPA